MPIIVTGCETGLVLDIGCRESRCVAIMNGRPLHTTLRVAPLGVIHARNRFENELKALYPNCSVFAEPDKLVDMFERFVVCDVVDAISLGDRALVSATDTLYTWDGQEKINIPGRIRSSCLSELLWGRQFDGYDASEDELGGLVGLVMKVLETCNLDTKVMVSTHVVFCGGGSCIPGLCKKICSEVNAKGALDSESSSSSSPPSVGSVVLNYRDLPFEGSLLTWLGGSIFASLKSNEEKYTQYAEWEQAVQNFEDISRTHTGDKPAIRMPDWMSCNPKDWKFVGPCTKLE